MALCFTIPDPQHETAPLQGKNLPKTLFNSMLNNSTESVGVLFLSPALQTPRKPLTLSTQCITSFTTGSRSFGSGPLTLLGLNVFICGFKNSQRCLSTAGKWNREFISHLYNGFASDEGFPGPKGKAREPNLRLRSLGHTTVAGQNWDSQL